MQLTGARLAWLVAALSTIAAALLAANQFYPGLFKPGASKIKAATEAVRFVLKDPDSARFSSVYMGPDDKYACGDVNAKNEMGGYVGATMFLLQVSTGDVQFLPPTPSPSDSTQEQISALEKRIKFMKDVKTFCGDPPPSGVGH